MKTQQTHHGLQAERTALAWRRTALSLLVASLTLAKFADLGPARSNLAWLLIGGCGAAAIFVISTKNYRGYQPGSVRPAPWLLIMISAATSVSLALWAVAAVLLA